MKNIIILQVISNPSIQETWGSLTEICEKHPDLIYSEIRTKKFPFDYKGIRFTKVPYKQLFIIQNTLI